MKSFKIGLIVFGIGSFGCGPHIPENSAAIHEICKGYYNGMEIPQLTLEVKNASLDNMTRVRNAVNTQLTLDSCTSLGGDQWDCSSSPLAQSQP